MESIDLARERFPNYQLFSNGTVINKKTNSPLTLVGGRYAELWQDGKCRSFSVAMLLRRYFHNELKELPEDQVVNLSFVGYPDYSITFDGRIWNHRVEDWMYPSLGKSGFVEASLTDRQGHTTHRKLHRLVATAFIPNPFNYNQVEHKDGNREHNAATNLQWTTNLKTMQEARKNGRMPAVITDENIHKACQMILNGYSNKEIAKAVGTYAQLIYHIRNGHIHCDISKQYGIEENRIRGRKIDWRKYHKTNDTTSERYTRKGVDA